MAGLEAEVVQFYLDNGYRFSDFFDARRHGGVKLSEAQVKAGGKEYYDKVKAGEINPRQIEIGWGVIEHAKRARFDDFSKDNDILQRYGLIIEDLEGSLAQCERGRRYLWVVLWPLLAGFLYLLYKVYGGIFI